jgi:hypothetical protein
MNGSTRFGWGYAVAAALFGVAIAMFAYNAGIADGTASGGAANAARGVHWGWHGAGFLWPLFWVAFLVFIFRGACWRRHYWYGGPYRPYGPRPPADDDEFDQWHRRAHERMTEERPADDSGRRG